RWEAESGLTSAGVLPTVTSWLIAAKGRVTRSGADGREPTVTRTVVGRNPSKVMRMSYRPGATRSKRNTPAASAVVESIGVPVAARSSTWAAGSTAPVGSTTVPVMGCPLWDWAACAPHATAIVNRTAPANAWMGISWSSGTTEQPQEAQRQPGYVGDEEHSGAENAGHRQGRARHFEHGLVEPIGREQDVQTHERRQIPELEVCDEDDSEVHRVDAEGSTERDNQRYHDDDRGKNL